jgi:NAD(P)-dependent dehydrogenase (short-subunit alcohol dehydrogenase family)
MDTAYITGADRGLGFALTQVFLEKGYKVFAGQYMPGWEQLEKLKERFGGCLTILPLDVSDMEQVTAAAKAVREEISSLDLLINVAGIASKNGNAPITEQYGEEDFQAIRRMYDVNALGPLRVTNSVVGLILEGEGKKIVNISSEAGSAGGNWRKNGYGYCMSKSALNMQSAILQHSLMDKGVKVMCLHPGWLRSYMSGELNEKATVDPLDAAWQIAGLLENPVWTGLESPVYMDYRGIPLPW